MPPRLGVLGVLLDLPRLDSDAFHIHLQARLRHARPAMPRNLPRLRWRMQSCMKRTLHPHISVPFTDAARLRRVTNFVCNLGPRKSMPQSRLTC